MASKTKKTPVSRAAQSILRGLKQAEAYERGSGTAVVHKVAASSVDVAELRAQLGMSQADFATTFGVTKRAIEEWEQGKRQPRGAARTLLQLIAREPATIARLLTAGA